MVEKNIPNESNIDLRENANIKDPSGDPASGPGEGNDQGLFEIELEDGTKRIIDQKGLEKLLEMEKNYPALQKKYGQATSELGELKKSTSKKSTSTGKVGDPAGFTITSEDVEDPDLLAEKLNKFAANLKKDVKTTLTDNSSSQQVKNTANTIISNDPRLKDLDVDEASEIFDAAVNLENIRNQKDGVTVTPNIAAYKKAIDNFFILFGGNGKVKTVTKKQIIKSIKSAGGEEIVKPIADALPHGSLAEKFLKMNKQEQKVWMKELEDEDGRVTLKRLQKELNEGTKTAKEE